MSAPNLLSVMEVVTLAQTTGTRTVLGNWVPARPLGLYSIRNRFRLAWLVFTGRADALIWPGNL